LDPSIGVSVAYEAAKAPSSVVLLVYVLGLSLLPFVAVMASSYIKLVVVMHLLRNALGIQQIPPNLALNGLAIILSAYIMAPALSTSFEAIVNSGIDPRNPDVGMLSTVLSEAAQPIIDFMLKHSDSNQRDFFVRASLDLWPADFAAKTTDKNLLILLPAFTMSELKAAFEIGFLLYMPFIAIDLIVSNILLAMGMMMVSPMTISLPFKLLLFVVVDGWTKLVHGLVMSYA
jgi:type III secretion protein R